VFLIFPAGVIPFTYVSSFLFTNENLARTFTIFLHFVFAGIGGIVVLILRLIESTTEIGDILLWVLKIVPTFSLTNSVMYAANKDQLIRERKSVSDDDFDIDNMSGDIVFLAAHFVFWTLCLIIIEVGALNWINQLLNRTRKTLEPIKNLE